MPYRQRPLWRRALLIVAGARSAVRFVCASPRCQEDRRALKTALWLLIAACSGLIGGTCAYLLHERVKNIVKLEGRKQS